MSKASDILSGKVGGIVAVPGPTQKKTTPPTDPVVKVLPKEGVSGPIPMHLEGASGNLLAPEEGITDQSNPKQQAPEAMWGLEVGGPVEKEPPFTP